MTTFLEAAQGLAAAVEAAVTDVDQVHALPQSGRLGVKSVVVAPAPTWGSFDPANGSGATYCTPAISWEIILIAPTTDYMAAFQWLSARVGETIAAFDADPTLGGIVDGAVIESWTRPERISVGSGQDAIGCVISLAPMVLEP